MKLVEIRNSQPLTTSKIVADVFKKPHKTVLRNIDNMDCSDEFRERNFVPSHYLSPQNKKITCFNITRDGVSFLCMGFTGREAAKWKEAYISAFNEMERGLLNIDERLTKLANDAKEIKFAGSQWAKMGHEINQAKKGHLLEVERVMEDVQLKLEY